MLEIPASMYIHTLVELHKIQPLNFLIPHSSLIHYVQHSMLLKFASDHKPCSAVSVNFHTSSQRLSDRRCSYLWQTTTGLKTLYFSMANKNSTMNRIMRLHFFTWVHCIVFPCKKCSSLANVSSSSQWTESVFGKNLLFLASSTSLPFDGKRQDHFDVKIYLGQ